MLLGVQRQGRVQISLQYLLCLPHLHLLCAKYHALLSLAPVRLDLYAHSEISSIFSVVANLKLCPLAGFGARLWFSSSVFDSLFSLLGNN